MVEEKTAKTSTSCDRLARVLNTAVIASKLPQSSNINARLSQLMASPAFSAIAHAVQSHATASGLPEQQAAQEVLTAFRELDSVWDDYIFQEGLDRLKSQITS